MCLGMLGRDAWEGCRLRGWWVVGGGWHKSMDKGPAGEFRMEDWSINHMMAPRAAARRESSISWLTLGR